MHSDLDILGVLNPIKYPSFPTATKALAVLAQRLDISAALIVGVFRRKRDDIRETESHLGNTAIWHG